MGTCYSEPVSSSGELPSGTVTFLFTDIEGSTRARARAPRAVRRSARRAPAAPARGVRRDTGAARSTRRATRSSSSSRARATRSRRRWRHSARSPSTRGRTGGSVRVRIGHAHGRGLALDDGRYVGLAVHRGARISRGRPRRADPPLQHDAGRRRGRPAGRRSACVDLGEHRLKDLPRPERIFQLVAPGLARTSRPRRRQTRRRSRAASASWPRRRRRNWQRGGDGPGAASSSPRLPRPPRSACRRAARDAGRRIDAQASVPANAVGRDRSRTGRSCREITGRRRRRKKSRATEALSG